MDLIVDSRMFKGIQHMQRTDFWEANLRYLAINLDEACYALNLEMKSINRFQNMKLDQKETDVLKFFKFKRSKAFIVNRSCKN